jgi:nuclear pore complex protein Nup53
MGSMQDGGGYAADYGVPLLFTMPADQPLEYRTPLARSPLRESGSASARHSVTPPGSVHTDTTPPLPPPIVRLHDTLMAGAVAVARPHAAVAVLLPCGVGAGRQLSFTACSLFSQHPSLHTLACRADVEPSGLASPTAAGEQQAAAAAAAAQAAGAGSMLRVEPYGQADDTWVTVFGFGADDLPLVLREFQRCGDILQWGTFGASPQSNFMHIEFQTKYGAQRALLRSGEQLSGSLIIGVKQLDARHKALVEAWSSSGGGGAGTAAGSDAGRLARAPVAPVRPYKFMDATGAQATQALPTRSRTWMQKVNEYVLGI